MNRRKFIVNSALLSLGAAGIPFVSHGELEQHQRLGKGSLDISLEIFNLWDVQPATKQALLIKADEILRPKRTGSFANLAADSEFQGLAKAAGLTHLGGPMLGNISEMGADVWIRTLKPAQVSVEINGNVFGPLATTTEQNLTAIIPITGMKPGDDYPYKVLIDGKPARIPTTARLRTVSHDKTTIAFGSCWHRWGLNHPQMDILRERRPSALLAIGDIAVQDRGGHIGMVQHDILMRDLTPRWNDFVATVPVYVGWDDHDYCANDKSAVSKNFSAVDRSNVRKAFTESWVNPQYGLNGKSTFLRTRIGPCDILMTDNRFARKKGSYLGKEQHQWLKEQLLDCKGPFIILSCGTMWSDFVSNGKDSWGKYDQEGREEIFQLIEEHQIPGVLLISGDRHGARGFTLPRPGGFNFYEFGGACFGGRIGPPAKDPKWTTQLYGIAAEYAFSEFEFNTSKSDPEVTFRLMNETGGRIHELTLTRSQLTPQKRTRS